MAWPLLGWPLMGRGTFTENIDRLIKQAEGRWRAGVVVDQVYAHYQEANPQLRHPRGGQAFYLRDTLYLGQWFARMAPRILDRDGLHVGLVMRDTAEGLAAGVFIRAPWEFNDLRRSGSPYVTRDGVQVFHREPTVKRLSEQQLREKGRLRYLGHHRR